MSMSRLFSQSSFLRPSSWQRLPFTEWSSRQVNSISTFKSTMNPILNSRMNSRMNPRMNSRSMTVYGFGSQWSGALGRGFEELFLEEAPEIRPEDEGLRHWAMSSSAGHLSDEADLARQAMVVIPGTPNHEILGADAGWGHTALLARAREDPNSATKLLMCGRPHDFQSLLRLRRLPRFLRNFAIRQTLRSVRPAHIPTAIPSTEPTHKPANQITTQPTNHPQSLQHQSTQSLEQPPVIQQIASFLAGEEVTSNEPQQRFMSIMPTLSQVTLPNGEIPAIQGDSLLSLDSLKNNNSDILHTTFQKTLATSAGLTAVLSTKGTLYTFGLNHRGQCGIGSYTPHVWTPTPITLHHNRQEHNNSNNNNNNPIHERPFVSVALGLQHGVALDCDGRVYCWGKGERGQLGQSRRRSDVIATDLSQSNEEQSDFVNQTMEYAVPVINFYDPNQCQNEHDTTAPMMDTHYIPLLSPQDARVLRIAAGMNHSVAVTHSNHAFVWGKNCSLSNLDNADHKRVQDSPYPRHIHNLPPNLRIDNVTCGSHHASFLMEDGSVYAVGVATDNAIPLWEEAVEILPPGTLEQPIWSFEAGFDRTVIVSGGTENGVGRQVIEIQLWSHPELRRYGAVLPSWMEWLNDHDQGKKVKSVHRGWMHTVVVMEK